jgi:hypothetical protein
MKDMAVGGYIFEEVRMFTFLGTLVTRKNEIREDIKVCIFVIMV